MILYRSHYLNDTTTPLDFSMRNLANTTESMPTITTMDYPNLEAGLFNLTEAFVGIVVIGGLILFCALLTQGGMYTY